MKPVRYGLAGDLTGEFSTIAEPEPLEIASGRAYVTFAACNVRYSFASLRERCC